MKRPRQASSHDALKLAALQPPLPTAATPGTMVMAPVGPFHAAFRLGLMAAKGAQAPEAAAVTSIKAPSTGSHQQLPMQGAAAASLTLPQGPAPALLTLVREVQEEELDGGGRTDGSIASSVASSSAFSAVAEALALSVEGDGDEAAAAAAVESGEGWGFFSPMEWEGEEEVSVNGEEKEEEEEEDQVVLRRPDNTPLCLSDSRWTAAGHKRAALGGWMPFPSSTPTPLSPALSPSSSISSLTSTSSLSDASSSTSWSSSERDDDEDNNHGYPYRYYAPLPCPLSPLPSATALRTSTASPSSYPCIPPPFPVQQQQQPQQPFHHSAEKGFLAPTTLAAVLEECAHGTAAVMLTEAHPPFLPVHLSKGFSLLTGWDLHFLSTGCSTHQPLSFNGAAAIFPAAALFCPSSTHGQTPAVTALMAEAEATGFGRADLWIRSSSANHLILCHVAVAPVLDRAVVGRGGVCVFCPRLTHLKWTFARVHDGMGVVGKEARML